jgi:hypothetical protein
LSGEQLAKLELEKDFQQRVVQFARLNGWRVYAVPDSRRATLAGYPDLTMWHPKQKRILWAELKRETGKLSESQKVVLSELEESGAIVHVWRPSDWNIIVNTLIRNPKKN